MHQYPLVADPVAVVGVHFEVEHRLSFVTSFSMADARLAVKAGQTFVRAQLRRGNPFCMVGRPEGMLFRDSERYWFARYG